MRLVLVESETLLTDMSLRVSKTMNGDVVQSVVVGHQILDDYLEFVAARARPNTVLAVAYDLKVFFTEIVKQPVEVTAGDVLAFIKAQRAPRRGPGVETPCPPPP
jgi:integrase/recombinase XerD